MTRWIILSAKPGKAGRQKALAREAMAADPTLRVMCRVNGEWRLLAATD
jgi:hypothetical protein